MSARVRAGAWLRRTLVFAVGVAVHLLTTTSFAYLLGFLLDARVPRTVNRGGAPARDFADVALDVALVLCFVVPHSALAREPAKRWLARVVGPALVRSAYNLVAVLAIALLAWAWRPIPQPVWSLAPGPAATFATALFWGGWGLCAWAALRTNLWELTGVVQAWAALRGRTFVPGPLRVGGPYRLVRHPLYTGFLLALWATPHMTRGHLLFAASLSLYVLVGLRLEERDLVRAFGPPYVRYREGVPALVPAWPRRGPASMPATKDDAPG